RDAIRHWAHGIGDRNPLWAAARIAPPTILFAMDRIVSGYVTGLPGIHAMYAGTQFRWRRAIREGDRVVGRSVLQDLQEKASTFARRAIKQTYRTTFVDGAGAVVCEADSWCFRTERDHWDEDLARAVGVPAPYDYGPGRVAWLGHLVTNWMGDAGSLVRLDVQVRRHNLIGDTTWCRGRVAAKGLTEDRGEVTLDL